MLDDTADPLPNDPFVYRVIVPKDWATAQETGQIPSVPVDQVDGYFHLSPHDQVLTTARLYFRPDMSPAVLEFDVDALAPGLVWEAVEQRGGRLFPHLYADRLPLSAVTAWIELIVTEDGGYRFGQRKAIGVASARGHQNSP